MLLRDLTLVHEALGLDLAALVDGAASVSRGGMARIGALWWGPGSFADAQAGNVSSVVVDVAFLTLLVIAVIAVVKIRQRGEESRLDLARQLVARGMEVPPELFPSSAAGDLRRGIVLISAGLGLLGGALGMPGLGSAGLVPGCIGLGYLVSYFVATRRRKVP